MITREYVEIFKKYNGSGDGFFRCATSEEKMIMNYKCWSLIDNFLQDLSLIKKGVASASFIKLTNEKLKEYCDNEETMKTLRDNA